MICVDASVAAKWIFPEEYDQQARALYRNTSSGAERIVAPPVLPIEVTNIVRQRMRRAKPPAQHPLSIAEAREALERYLSFPIELSLPLGLHQRAFELSVAHELAAVYDAYYLALAQMLGCLFWTADRRLVNDVQGKLPFVAWIGDYTLS